VIKPRPKRNAGQRELDRLWHQRRALRAKRDALVTDHLPLVASIARSIWLRLPSSFDLDDLVAEGHLTLIQAAARYDPQSYNGTPFSAYARHAIRGAILEICRRKRFVEQTRPSIDSPDRNAPPYGYSDREKDPKYETEAVRGLERLATQPSVEISIDHERSHRRLEEAISWLPAAERKLLRMIYGVDEPKIYSVAHRMKITRTEAAVLHASAIEQLRTILAGGSRPRARLRRAA